MWIESEGLYNTNNFEAMKVVKDSIEYALVGFIHKEPVYILRHGELEEVLDDFSHIKRCLRAGYAICSIA